MTDIVHVWLIRTDLPAGMLAGLIAVLDEEERRRASAFDRPGRREAFVAAHGAARLILGGRLGVPPEHLRWCRGRHGKPELAGAGASTGIQTNLSHSGHLALLAVTAHRGVGVDLQRLPPAVDPVRMAARFYPDAEARFVAAGAGPAERARRFAALWTRKEACVKAAGGRLGPGLRLAVRGPVVADPGGVLPGPYALREVPVPRGFRAAVALAGTASFDVVPHRWPGEQIRPVPDTMAVDECGGQ